MPDKPLIRQNGSAAANPPSTPSAKTQQNQPQTDAPGGAAPNRPSWAEAIFHEDFPLAEYRPDCNCHLDHELRHDLDLQLNHFDCYDAERKELLEKVYKKVTRKNDNGTPGYWNNLRQWKDYDWQASVIALSRYANRQRFCDCGFYGYSCDDPLCPRCCFNDRAKPVLQEFRRAFSKGGDCFYLVVSLSRQLDEKKRFMFKDLDREERAHIKEAGQAEQADLKDYGIKPANADLEDYDLACQALWRIYGEVLHKFTGRKRKQIFSGAFGGPELSVRFRPLAVLPHANYIVFSPGLSSDDLRRFRRELSRRFRNSRRVEPGLYPKVALYRLQEPRDFQDVVKYMFKPIAVGFAYALAADSVVETLNQPVDVGSAYALAAEAGAADRQILENLNRQTDCFLERLSWIFDDVRRIHRYGCCSPGSHDYIGVVTLEKEEKRQKDAERRAKKRAEQDEIRKVFPGYQPYRRHKTEKQREDEHRMKRSYHRLVEEGELPGKPPKRWLHRDKAGRKRGTAAGLGSAKEPDPSAKVQQTAPAHAPPPTISSTFHAEAGNGAAGQEREAGESRSIQRGNPNEPKI